MAFKLAKDLIPTKTCWLCEGEGYLYDEIGTEHDTGAVIEQKTECPECHGVGTLEVERDGDDEYEAQYDREHFDD